MTYFIYQTALVTTIAIFAGSIIGWWLHHYYGQKEQQSSNKDLELVKNYLAESIKENARIKIQLKCAEDKVDALSSCGSSVIQGVDFEAYQVFENTVKEAQMRKYLN